MDSIERVKALIESVVLEHKCTIYDVVVDKEANELFLRVFIDKDGGLDMDTCVTLSEQINLILDKDANIEEIDYVEVSSPGLERPLFNREQVSGAIGDYVMITYLKEDELMEVIGTLVSFDNDELFIEYFVKGVKKKLKIAYDDIESARLAIKL